jgi:hypothetical protein
MPYVPLIPVGRIVMTWIWSFSCDVNMKNVLKWAADMPETCRGVITQ